MRDLTSLKIGVVAGFSNGPFFDAMVRKCKLSIGASSNDMLNLCKLEAEFFQRLER